MSRDWTLYLEDIADVCRLIEEFTAGMSGESFAGNALAFHATVRNLAIVGEAAKRLPEEAKARMPEVDWAGAARFRDVVAHRYFALDPAVVWSIDANENPCAESRCVSRVGRSRPKRYRWGCDVANRRVNAIAKRLSPRWSQRQSPEASVKIEKLDDFLGRARKLARLADAGKPIAESFVISFEDPAELLAVLTPARLILFRVIKQKPGSIASIAQAMKRDRSAVTRDVAALGKAGLVTVTEKAHPGRGRMKEVRARANAIKLEALVA